MAEQLLNMIWGTASAILTLLGLVGIFVSLSSQQKLEKIREIYWELLLPPIHTFQKSAYEQKGLADYVDFLRSRYSLYRYLEKQKADNLTGKMLSFSDCVIFVVISIWGVGIFALGYKCALGLDVLFLSLVFLMLIASSWLLIFFKDLLSSVENLRKEEKLPTTEDLLDVLGNKTKVNVFKFMIDTVAYHVSYDQYTQTLRIVFEHSLPFYNFTTKINAEIYDENGMHIGRYCSDNNVNFDSNLEIEKGRHCRVNIKLDEKAILKMHEVKIGVEYSAIFQKNAQSLRFEDINNLWVTPELFIVQKMSAEEISSWI